MNEVYERTGYRLFLENDEKAEDRTANVEELISGAANYENNAENPSFEDYMDNLALVSDIDNYDEEIDAAILMTMHAAKGLEFPIIFICSFDEGIFPSFMNTLDSSEMEEERRLCYVGITRAKEILHITCAKSRMLYGKTSNYKPSRFLSEIPEELLDITDNVPEIPDFMMPKSSFSSYSAPENSLFGEPKPSPKMGDVFKAGDSVIHKKFGRGIIISANPVGNDVHYEIAFDSVGTKNLLGLYAKLTKAD